MRVNVTAVDVDTEFDGVSTMTMDEVSDHEIDDTVPTLFDGDGEWRFHRADREEEKGTDGDRMVFDEESDSVSARDVEVVDELEYDQLLRRARDSDGDVLAAMLPE